MTGKLIIISGPSGVGKGTIVDLLLKDPELNLYWAKSYTTRNERESDKDENHYLFVDEPKFKTLEKSGEIIESNFYNNNWYGSSKSEIDRGLNNSKNILKEVEVNGGIAYKKLYPEAILIFIKTDLESIKNRLIKRGQNTPEEIKERLEVAQRELSFQKDYDFVVENPEGHPESAAREIKTIILQRYDTVSK